MAKRREFLFGGLHFGVDPSGRFGGEGRYGREEKSEEGCLVNAGMRHVVVLIKLKTIPQYRTIFPGRHLVEDGAENLVFRNET